MSNQFQSVIDDLEETPQPQRCNKMIEGIVKQMTQSSTPQTQQLGQQLQQAQEQLVRAFNQRQQGS